MENSQKPKPIPTLSLSREEPRKNGVLKQRADIRAIAFEVLTANSNREWVKEQIKDISDVEEVKAILMVLVDHYHEQIRNAGGIIVELLNQ